MDNEDWEGVAADQALTIALLKVDVEHLAEQVALLTRELAHAHENIRLLLNNQPSRWHVPTPPSLGWGCPVCHISGVNGYVCYRTDCPRPRATCNGTS